MSGLVVTATNCITSVGHDGRMTAAAVRACVSRMFKYDEYLDGDDNPITVAQIKGVGDDSQDAADRMAEVAVFCLENLSMKCFQNNQPRLSKTHLLLGVSSDERPGRRFDEHCLYSLQMVLEKWVDKPVLQVVPQGNASMPYAFAQAVEIIKNDPAAVCIIGGIDSLLQRSTLNWFEGAGRLKSESYGRQQGLIAGEAVGFMVIESQAQARQSVRPVLAHIAGLGLAKEPNTRASNSPGRNSGLTNACHAAMKNIQSKDISAVFGDLNGENSRAMEWSMADMRCFKERHAQRKQCSPANCYGDIGAASGVVLANIVTQGVVRNWLQSPVLLFCSDDHGACGALILTKG